VGHVVHLSASVARNVVALFVILDGTGTGSIKSTPGHVMPNLFSASGGICRSRSAFRCVKHRRTIFYARVGPVRFP
jgi:hypothetical protein